MNEDKLDTVLRQLSVLCELQEQYGGKTLDNVVQNLQAKLKLYLQS